MSIPVEARLNGQQAGRPGQAPSTSEKCAAVDALVQAEKTRDYPAADEATFKAPRMFAYSVCVGGAATVGGLVVAALVRPQSPNGVWFLATLALAALGGVIAVPAVLSLEQRRMRHRR